MLSIHPSVLLSNREREANSLKSQILKLNEEIEKERKKMEAIKMQSDATHESFSTDMYEKLGEEIRKVYAEVGFGSPTTQLSMSEWMYLAV